MRESGEVTVASLRNRAHGEGSRALEELVWQVCDWRDGQVIRWQIYESEQEALRAAGLAA